MICYHSTTREAVDSILSGGFRDNTGYYGFGFPMTGVWLAPEPVDEGYGTNGDTVLEVAIPDRVDLTPFELTEGLYREWCVPAALINEHAVVTLAEIDDE